MAQLPIVDEDNEAKELIRHKSIETTLKFYAKCNATLTADAVWNAFQPDRVTEGMQKSRPHQVRGSD